MESGEKENKDQDLLWGCFVNWMETLEKVEGKGKQRESRPG
jgi:hypothetical protein